MRLIRCSALLVLALAWLDEVAAEADAKKTSRRKRKKKATEDAGDGVCSAERPHNCAASEVDVPLALAAAAAREDCSSGDNATHGSPWQMSEREESLLLCVMGRWYPEGSGDGLHGQRGLGESGGYGEITAKGAAAVFGVFGRLGTPLSADDTFFDLGSGMGKMVLQAHLTTEVGSATGIEVSEGRHTAARAVLAASGAPADARRVELVQGDARKAELWEGASALYACSAVFPALLMLELSWALAGGLRPGSVVVTNKALPGCHPALRLLGTLSAEMSWSPTAEVHVYAVPPMDARPPTWLSVTKTQWATRVADETSTALKDASPTCTDLRDLAEAAPADLGACFHQQWPGVPPVQARRAFAAAAVVAQKGKNTLAAQFPGTTVKWSQIAAASMHIAVGDGNEKLVSPVSCASRELASALDAEEDARAGGGAVGNDGGAAGKDGPVAVVIKGLDDVHARSAQGETLMHEVARMRRISPELVVADLVKRRADVAAQDKTGRTPLHIAAEVGKHVGLARALLELQADVHALDITKETPLSTATKKGHEAFIDLLLNAGLEGKDRGTVVMEGEEVWDVTLDEALLLAVQNGHDKAVQKLIEKRADVNARKDYCAPAGMRPDCVKGLTPLMMSARGTKRPVSVIKALLEAKAHIDERDGETKMTALHHAVDRGQGPVVQLLLQRRADIDMIDADGRGPLHFLKPLSRHDKSYDTLERMGTLELSHYKDPMARGLAYERMKEERSDLKSPELQDLFDATYTNIADTLMSFGAGKAASQVGRKRKSKKDN